jgi:hypothetical protein
MARKKSKKQQQPPAKKGKFKGSGAKGSRPPSVYGNR